MKKKKNVFQRLAELFVVGEAVVEDVVSEADVSDGDVDID